MQAAAPSKEGRTTSAPPPAPVRPHPAWARSPPGAPVESSQPLSEQPLPSLHPPCFPALPPTQRAGHAVLSAWDALPVSISCAAPSHQSGLGFKSTSSESPHPVAVTSYSISPWPCTFFPPFNNARNSSLVVACLLRLTPDPCPTRVVSHSPLPTLPWHRVWHVRSLPHSFSQ